MVFATPPARCGDNPYTLDNGTMITDADIDQLCTEFESESWTGGTAEGLVDIRVASWVWSKEGC